MEECQHDWVQVKCPEKKHLVRWLCTKHDVAHQWIVIFHQTEAAWSGCSFQYGRPPHFAPFLYARVCVLCKSVDDEINEYTEEVMKRIEKYKLAIEIYERETKKDEKPQGSEKPSSDKPNPNIVPPTYDVVTEG